MYDYHKWTLITRDEQAYCGEDDYPTDMLKMNCKAFIYELRCYEAGIAVGRSPDIEISVPEGHELVFKRRVAKGILIGEDGGEYVEWKYIVTTKPLIQERCDLVTVHPP